MFVLAVSYLVVISLWILAASIFKKREDGDFMKSGVRFIYESLPFPLNIIAIVALFVSIFIVVFCAD